MARILIFSAGVIPCVEIPTTSGGMRALQMCRALEAKNHEVMVSCPFGAQSYKPFTHLFTPDMLRLCFVDRPQEVIYRECKPDVVIFASNWQTLQGEWWPDCPVILDLCGPLIVESALHYGADPDALTNLLQRKLAVLSHADFFLCAGDRQQWYFRQALALAQVGLHEELPMAVMPFGIDPDWVQPREYSSQVGFVYAGGFYPWLDPEVAIEVILSRIDAAQSGSFTWIGGLLQPNRALEQRFERLQNLIAASSRASRSGHLPFGALMRRLSELSVSVEWMQSNVERDLAVTARTPLSLALGLPVLMASNQELAAPIEKNQAGWVLPPGDASAVREAVDEIIRNPAEVARRGRHAQELARDRLDWHRQAAPLLAFVSNPRFRAHKRPRDLKRSFQPLTPGEISLLRKLRSPAAQALRKVIGPCYRAWTRLSGGSE
ncbi:MAG: glycosyltransferase family 4 protein [Planctomycetes bacterium]|nr:glycosyltransferase family 4 protein [Planctomycetota bacterium]